MVSENRVGKILYGECPSCGHRGKFKCIGSQIWPDAVAANLGIPKEIDLYQCENCLTTISEPSLKQDE